MSEVAVVPRSSRPGPKNITLPEIMAALTKHAGVISLAAKELGVLRPSLAERIKNNPELQAHRASIDEDILDAAEAVILDAMVNKKDTKVARWFADRKGKARGYTTRVETTGAGGAPLAAPKVEVNIRFVGKLSADQDIV